MYYWKWMQVIFILIYICFTTDASINLPAETVLYPLQKIKDESRPDNKRVNGLDPSLSNDDDNYHYGDLSPIAGKKDKLNSFVGLTEMPTDEENGLETANGDLENPLVQKVHPLGHNPSTHQRHLIIPSNLWNRQNKLRLRIDRALKPKFKTGLNHGSALLGRTQNRFDGENSEELLKDILSIDKGDLETSQDYFKGALLTKSKVYNITKMPDNNLQESYHVHKKENISVDLRLSNANLSDTHIITLETIIKPHKYTLMGDNSDGKSSEYIGENDNWSDHPENPTYSTELVGDIPTDPNRLNLTPPPDSDLPRNTQTVPTEFVGGTFVSTIENPPHDELSSIETETLAQTNTAFISTEIVELNNSTEQTTSLPEQRQELSTTTQNQTPSPQESESGDYFTNSLEIVRSSIFQEEQKTADQVTDKLGEMTQDTFVTEFPKNESKTEENGTQTTTTGANDLNDGLDVESSNTHTSIAQDESPTIIPGNDEVLQSVNDNTLDETGDDLPTEHSVEIYAGSITTPVSNQIVDSFTSEGNTTPDSTNDSDIVTESATRDPSEETLTELCFPLLNYKNVSLYSLLTGNFFLNYKGKKIPLKLGDEPMQTCHSGTKKCKLHLKFSNRENNKRNKNDLESIIKIADEDLSKHIKKRQATDNSNFQQNNKIIDYIYSTTGNVKPVTQIQPEKESEDIILNKILNIENQQANTNRQDLKQKDINKIPRQTIKPLYKLIEKLKKYDTHENDFIQPNHQAHIHDNIRAASSQDVEKRHLRSTRSAKPETEEKPSCGCGDILGRALPPIPPYEHFLGKRLDILTNIAHAVKDWYISSS